MRVLLLSLAMASMWPHASYADSITYFTHSQTEFYSDSTGLIPHQMLHENGAPSSNSSSFTSIEGTASASASANLSLGQVKAFAKATGSGTAPSGTSLQAFSAADIGDSFRAYSGNSPFSWSSSTTASFSFDVSGLVSLQGGAQNFSGFGLFIFEPGALDLYARWNLGEDTHDGWKARVIDSFEYILGPGETYPETTAQLTTFPTTVSASFTPGGDFDWAIWIATAIDIQSPLASKSGTADFSHTLGVSYIAPAGTTTYSGSGQFAGTSSLADAPLAEVPEPASVLLVLTGIGAFAARRRAKRLPNS